MLTTVRLVIYITSHSQAIIVSESMMLNVGSMRVLPEGDKVTCGIHSFTNFILCLFKTTFGMKPYLWCWKLIFHSIHGIVCVCESLSCVQLFATPWSVAHQALLSMKLLRQEYWSGLPFPSPGGLPNPGIKPRSPALGANSLPSELPGKPTWHSLFLNLKAKSIALICFNHDSLTLIFK